MVPGTIVATDKEIVFLQWVSGEERYEAVRKIKFSGIDEVWLDKYGLGRMAVIKKRDSTFDSFEVWGPHGQIADGPATEQLVKDLRSRLQPKEKAEPSKS